VLEVCDLWVAYGRRTVLRGVNLCAREGELLAVGGPNGCGKTTLIRAVTRVTPPRAGRILLGGEDGGRLSQGELAARVAVVPQNPALPDGFLVLDVVMMGRTPHLRLLQSEGRSDFEAVRRALEQTDSLELAYRPVEQLSGGERQRVVIARALAQETPVLLLDEPTAHLDIGHQLAIMELVRQLCRQRSLAVLAAVHDLTLASLFCDRAVMMDDGQVVAEGPPSRVLTPELIERVYGARVAVLEHPLVGRPVVVPLSDGRFGGGAEAAAARASSLQPGQSAGQPGEAR
jgi:iron complex transport system ATP-binding protein